MQMFLEFDDHMTFLEEMVAKKPEKITIASYGLYAGITYKGHDTTAWGEKYRLRSRDLLEQMRSVPNVKMLIGAQEYTSCKYKEKCIACEMKYAQTLFRLVSHADLFPEFEWRMTTQLHLKCAIFTFIDTVRGVAGGRNFADSTWADITFELTDQQISKLQDHTLNLWDEANPTTDVTVQELLENQKISEQALIALMNVAK